MPRPMTPSRPTCRRTSRRSRARRRPRSSCSSRPTARASPPRSPSPPSRRAPGWSCCRTCAGCTASTSELAERFAEAGHHAVAIDYFGRTAGVGARDEDFEYMPHVEQTLAGDDPGRRRRRRWSRCSERTGAIGVGEPSASASAGCTSFLAASAAGARPRRGRGLLRRAREPRGSARPRRLHHVDEMRCPVLGLFGGDDEAIPAAQVARLRERACRRPGVAHGDRRSTRARRTRSSTAGTRSTPPPARTPGGARCASSGRRGRRTERRPDLASPFVSPAGPGPSARRSRRRRAAARPRSRRTRRASPARRAAAPGPPRRARRRRGRPPRRRSGPSKVEAR